MVLRNAHKPAKALPCLRESSVLVKKVNRFVEGELQEGRDVGGVPKTGLYGSSPAEGLNSSTVEKVDRIEQTEEPHFGRGSHAIHDLASIRLDGFDTTFRRVLLWVMRFRQFRLDAVFPEDVIPSRTGLHLRVIVVKNVGNAMLPDEVLECCWTFAFGPHAIHRGKMAGFAHKELRTGNAAQARGRTEQCVRGKGFGKSALVELWEARLDVPA